MFSITSKSASKQQPKAAPQEEAVPPPRFAAPQPDDNDTSALEPCGDEYDGVEIEDEEWTDEQLMDYSRPGRRNANGDGKSSK